MEDLFLVDRVKTLQGKEYTLLNMPYYLAGRIEEYLDWLTNVADQLILHTQPPRP
jgi:hypothetical protein